MRRIVILLLGLILGMGAALAVEGKMLHLRHFLPSAEPAGMQAVADDAPLIKVFCGFAGSSGIAAILALFGEGCEF